MDNFENTKDLMERKINNATSGNDSYQDSPETNPLVVVDLGMKMIFSNQAFAYTFGLNETDDLSTLDAEPNLLSLIQSFSKSHYGNFSIDITVNPLSTPKNYSINAERIFINELEYFVLIFQSLAEKKQIETRINNLHHALEYGEIPVIITDIDGNITFTTNSFENILNTSIDVLYNNNLGSVFSFHLDNDEIEKLHDAIREKSVWTTTISSDHSKEKLRFMELKLNPVYIEDTSSYNFILTAHDITNYVLKNRLSQRSAKRQKSIINNISDLLLIIKKKDNFLWFENANDNFFKTFSIDKKNAEHEKVERLLPKRLYDKVLDSISLIALNEGDYVEFTINDLFSRHYNGKITFSEDKYEKEILYIVSLKDVTGQLLYEEQLKKAYEKEIQLNKLKTNLLENMSHEIRTPFNAIMGYSEIIEDCVKEGDYETIGELTVSVKEVMNRVLNLFSNIVEVSQIESGEIQIEREKINCNQVLRAVYNKKIEEAQSKKLDFELDIEDENLVIETDWVKLQKVLLSLADNSIKYTAAGTIKLQSYAIDGFASIIVIDTGKGISNKELHKLLEPFEQEEEGYTRNYQGAGLGLTLAYKLTSLIGGKFDIQSSKNIGTKVTLRFPLIDAEYSG
ncbi:MAG: PAS domain-containing sensor histidine kinase [Bacteroidetes bacterium]|nr:PAS domain-containing sensor histidine kinase [Bacteroidota bacterium]